MGMLTDSKGDHRVKAYDCITKIVTMHRSAVRVAFKHLRLDNKDPEEIFYANMMMAKECCIAMYAFTFSRAFVIFDFSEKRMMTF